MVQSISLPVETLNNDAKKVTSEQEGALFNRNISSTTKHHKH